MSIFERMPKRSSLLPQVPSHLSFPTSGAAIATDSGYSVTEWQQDTLVPADR